MSIIVGIALIGAAIIVLEPKLDYTKKKQLLLWFNKNHERKYIRLW